jgi:glycoprotein endo-alpha-1,2-mannosidase
MRYTVCCSLVVALVVATPVCASGAGPVTPSSLVTAFYYPWFGTAAQDGTYAHWAQDGSDPPDDIPSAFYPALGAYSSDNPKVLDDQMSEIRRAGIGQIAVSWWGRGSPEDVRLPAVAQAARLQKIGLAIHIEPYTGRNVASVEADVDYLQQTYGIDTFYIYQPFASSPPATWAPANDLWRTEGITVFAQTWLPGQAVAGHFPGIYTYDIVTWNGSKFMRICAEAHRVGLLCAPSVGPGFDAIRAESDPVIKPRLAGRTYDSMWHAAIAAGADQITITSFNEWQEGTQIEPAAPPGPHGGNYQYQSYNGAWGLEGSAAESAYLDRTAYWVGVYERAQEPAPYAGPN